jgi:hypothetical protein
MMMKAQASLQNISKGEGILACFMLFGACLVWFKLPGLLIALGIIGIMIWVKR